MSRDEWQIERDRAPWTEAMQREKDGATLARIVASDPTLRKMYTDDKKRRPRCKFCGKARKLDANGICASGCH
jgi:hypothetical protein